MSTRANQAIEVFKTLMKKVTIRIFSYDESGKLINRSSGFLYQPTPHSIPLVITAGHKLPVKGGFIETNVVENGHVLQIACGDFQVFYNEDDIDYAYSMLPVKAYKETLKKHEGVDLLAYQHEFLKAEKKEAYGFAVLNNYEARKIGDQVQLPLYECAEVGLELVRQTERINYFKPQHFQGDEYYQGASGSPIADPEGKITAILIGGTKDGLLLAARLDTIESFPAPIVVFTDDADCIAKIADTIKAYPHLESMMILKDYQKWQKLLTNSGGHDVYWADHTQKLNLLVTAMIAYSDNINPTLLTRHAVNLLNKLEGWLSKFPALTKDDNFRGKIKNPEAFNFLGTLSELSLACYFADLGHNIAFETKFVKAGQTAKKDVDITVKDKAGNISHFEVFMPNNESELKGFFESSDRDDYFNYKVWKKLEDKFGTAGFSGLSGKTYLAVNYAFFDEIYRNSVTPIFSNTAVFNSLKVSIPTDIEGILFFRDGFSEGETLYIDALIEAAV